MFPIFLEGLKLMGLGMGVVFLYLILLIYSIKLISFFFSNSDSELNSKDLNPKPSRDSNSEELVAVIAAAIIAHKQKNT
jgi:oxaloacetate decarboxylase (Na+ extruding) subunit gamma